jgi:hypothetical protein
MTTPEEVANISSLTLDDAASVVEIACALGQDVPAPEGTVVWQVRVDVRPDKTIRSELTIPVGIYGSFAAAERGLRNWIFCEWASNERSKGKEQLSELADADDTVVIKKYFDKYQSRRHRRIGRGGEA